MAAWLEGGEGSELERAADEFSPASRWPQVSAGLGGVRVVYTDLDGTMMGPLGNFLLNIKREYTLRPARALVEALRRGVDVVPVSGRSGRQLRETARVLGMNNYIAELGVEMVYDLGEKVIFNAGALGNECADLFDAIERTGAADFILSHYEKRIEYHTPWSNFRDCTPLFRGLVDLQEVNRLLDERFPGLVLVDNGVLPRTSPTLDVHELRAYHLMPKGVSKEKAVADDMLRRGFARSEAIAIGDSEADLAFAGEVGAFFMVRNGLYSNPHLAGAIAGLENVIVTEGFLNEGWAEAVELAVLL
ncbi:MAG: HAD family phosphatase [Actinobacteria bacterium]|jgi:hydroxymethylpyrimidine pyrophosphatase-like HAD family hydrolase|nr:MAG: HAD family phosphatase [Actinomycetota bacterium]